MSVKVHGIACAISAFIFVFFFLMTITHIFREGTVRMGSISPLLLFGQLVTALWAAVLVLLRNKPIDRWRGVEKKGLT